MIADSAWRFDRFATWPGSGMDFISGGDFQVVVLMEESYGSAGVGGP